MSGFPLIKTTLKMQKTLICLLILWAYMAAAAMSPEQTGAKYLYPIEASWFADRYTLSAWNKVLDQFAQQGGSIVW